MLAMTVGNSIPMMAITFSALYGVNKINKMNGISSIKFINGGEHDGWLDITLRTGPFTTR